MNTLHLFILLAVVLALAMLPFVTWALFLGIMSLYRAREAGTLTDAATIPGKILLLIGYLLDFLLNMTVGTIVFLELPKEYLLSPRVSRLQVSGRGYRKGWAAWICHNLLDPFDPSGCHCKV